MRGIEEEKRRRVCLNMNFFLTWRLSQRLPAWMSWAGHISDVESRCSRPAQAELEPTSHLHIQQPNLNCVGTHTHTHTHLLLLAGVQIKKEVYKVNNTMGWLRARRCPHTMPSLFLLLFQWMMPILTLISNSLLAASLQSNEHATVSK